MYRILNGINYTNISHSTGAPGRLALNCYCQAMTEVLKMPVSLRITTRNSLLTQVNMLIKRRESEAE